MRLILGATLSLVLAASALIWRVDVPHGRLGRAARAANNPSRSHPANNSESPMFSPVQSRNTKNLGAGKLLVASRKLGDPNFAETVVLLVHYDDEGVVGLVLNRRTDIPLSKVFEELKAAKDRSDPVYLGGPVDTPMVFGLLQSPAKVEGAERIFGSVYLISKKTLFEQTISARPDPGAFHVYLGYAGWTNQQLRMEVDLGAWFIFPGDARSVFNADPDSLWRDMIRKTELKSVDSQPPAGDPLQPCVAGVAHPFAQF